MCLLNINGTKDENPYKTMYNENMHELLLFLKFSPFLKELFGLRYLCLLQLTVNNVTMRSIHSFKNLDTSTWYFIFKQEVVGEVVFWSVVCESTWKLVYNSTEKHYTDINTTYAKTKWNISNHFDNAVKCDVEGYVHCLCWIDHWSDIRIGICQDVANQQILAWICQAGS